MKISFIVTTYNVATYIDQCLNSLTACLRPGDEVIVVDDGSTDRTDLLVERRLATGFGPDVATQTILLGTNTIGGVGIPANIGLSHATREAVFFVDGDDWLEPGGFVAARAEFDRLHPDILIGNYLEYDDRTGQSAPPSDLNRWSELAKTPHDTHRIALSMIAVPWRKFYRRDFLGADIRFPEGDFFYEDNPFHWQVCRRATTIRFVDRVLCHHRMNRPGQTMAATGIEFLAFFDHFDTICAMLDADDGPMRQAALEWLVNNMSWHIARMTPGTLWAYAARAAQALEGQAPHWAAIRPLYAGTAIGGMVEALVRGQIAGTVAAWMAERSQNAAARVEKGLRTDPAAADFGARDGMTKQMERLAEQVQSLTLIAEFAALRALDDATDMTPADQRTPT